MPSRLSRLGFTPVTLTLAIFALALIRPDTSGASSRSRSEARSSAIVVIDPGHGGYDRGGIPHQRIAEKVMTLDVSLRLRDILKKSGYRVVMTRDSDVFVSLPGRVAIANSYRDAIFVCIHFNSATRSGANGIETYFYSKQSLPLASAIHYHVAGDAPTENRGVRRRGYYVLRKTRIPAVLVECGFLTNPTEARYAQSPKYRQKLAEDIARGIRGRFAVSRVTGTSERVADGTIPLQPFIDQTRVSHRHRSHSKHSSRKKRSSKRKKSSGSSNKKDDGSTNSKHNKSKKNG